MSEARAPGVPWHLWAVGVVAVLWNSYGCYDYTMTALDGADYMRSAGVSEELISYYTAMPAWMTAVWAIGVWGGALGGVLLLLRSKWALHVFIASFAGFAMSLVYYYVLSNGGELMGASAIPLQATIFIACLIFIWYAWFATKRGNLR